MERRDLALVVGELAANAVVHGRSPFTVSLHGGDEVSVGVSDQAPATPARRATAPGEAQHGRGGSRSWTTWPPSGAPGRVPGGKVVWARLGR